MTFVKTKLGGGCWGGFCRKALLLFGDTWICYLYRLIACKIVPWRLIHLFHYNIWEVVACISGSQTGGSQPTRGIGRKPFPLKGGGVPRNREQCNCHNHAAARQESVFVTYLANTPTSEIFVSRPKSNSGFKNVRNCICLDLLCSSAHNGACSHWIP